MANSLSEESRRKLEGVSISTLSTCLYRRGFRNVYLKDLVPVAPNRSRMVGEAYTLRLIPAREDTGSMPSSVGNLAVHQRAFEECPPGHVLVIDTGRETDACTCGNLLIGRLKARGVAGIVTDGGYRDIEEIARIGLPAYHARPAPPPSYLRLHAVALNEPIGCAKVAVYPGDVIVGDSDGVVAIPVALANEIAAEANELTQYDAFAAQEIASGRSLHGLYPPSDAARAEFKSRAQARKS